MATTSWAVHRPVHSITKPSVYSGSDGAEIVGWRPDGRAATSRRAAIVAYVREMEPDLPDSADDRFVMLHWGPLRRLLGVKVMKLDGRAVGKSRKTAPTTP